MTVDRGPELFARFAIPPNTRSYCGPIDGSLLDEALVARDLNEMRRLEREFEGAMPYLELIAVSAGIEDPLSLPVVAAYWLSGDLLDRVDVSRFGGSMVERFQSRAGMRFASLADGVAGGRPSHAFHVFCVYPWVGLLRGGSHVHPLHVLDECRVGWGTVTESDAGACTVAASPLRYDPPFLVLGPVEERRVVLPSWWEGRLSPGDQVAFHWSTAAVRLHGDGVERLEADTRRHLEIVNRRYRSLERALDSAS